MFTFARWIVRRGFMVVGLVLGCAYLFFSSDTPDEPASPWANKPVAVAAPKKSDSILRKLSATAVDKVGDYAESFGVKKHTTGNLDAANEAFGKASGN